MTNPCTACQDRARLRRELEDTIQRHLRTAESLYRDVMTATPSDLPRLRDEVTRITAGLLQGDPR